MKRPFSLLLVSGIALATIMPSATANSLILANDPGNERSTTVQPINWRTNAANLRNSLDRDFTFICPPNGSFATVWGTDIYTDDSAICTAAVHSGLINRVDGGQVTIGIRSGQNSYTGSVRNNVRSLNYRKWHRSFIFVR
jgi:hypothetical protein